MSRIIRPVVYRYTRAGIGASSGPRKGNGKVMLVVASEKHIPVLEAIRESLDFELEIIGSRFLNHPSAFWYVAELMGICDATLVCMEDSECMDNLKEAVEPFLDEMDVISIGSDASVWSITTVDRKLATRCYRRLLEGGETGYIRMFETLEEGLGWNRPDAR